MVAALAGFVVYMKDRQHYFTAFHLVAGFCVLSALVSATVSQYPQVALLKAGSLLLLFLYAATGARLAVMGQEQSFLRGLLLSSELIVYILSISYLAVGNELFDNSNSLGAIIGCFAVPVMLWGVIIADSTLVRRRRTLALLVGLLLLLSSYARAAIVGTLVASLFLCIGLRQFRLLIKGVAITVIFATFVALVLPRPENPTDSVIEAFFYKSGAQEDVLNSRRTAWNQTSKVIQQNPWFGSGFGTSINREGVPLASGGLFASAPQATREHGSSYLEIAEWQGLLGVLPFVLILVLMAMNVGRVFLWLRRTSNTQSLAGLMGALVAAGLAHAAFEDWMFAVGYYLTVFFWCAAFILVDVTPPREPSPDAAKARASYAWPRGVTVVTPGR
jgi:O-antigen ligase